LRHTRYGWTPLLGCAAILASLFLAAKPANAIPAFASRLGVPCKTCHEPIFPRLNRTGWIFRQLGYRTAGEMNSSVQPSGAGSHNLGDYIAISNTDRFDSVQVKGQSAQAAAYVSGFSLYVAGPASKNFGFWSELQPPTESFSETASGNGYAVTTGSSTSISPWVRYYDGQSASSFLYARVGKINVEGFQGNNSSVGSVSPNLLTKSVNSSTTSGDGAELGYSLNNDSLTAYLTEPSTGDSGTSVNKAIQYLHFIGKHDSSFQALYESGESPLVPTYAYNGSVTVGDLASGLPSSTTPYAWNDYSVFLLYANFRTPIHTTDAINFLAGYGNGNNHVINKTKDVLTGSQLGITETLPTSGASFNYHSWYGEVEYQFGTRLIPYLRYDNFHSGQPVGGTENINEYTGGIAYLIDENIKCNVDSPEGGSTVNTFRTSLQFLW
jgi:hypothetical protein